MKIMTNLELIAKMKELLNEPNYYGSGGNNWSSFINGWFVDCTCSIKAILWGGRFIPENRGKAHAGCNYGSNGVPDFTPSSCVDWIGATKGKFDTLVPGEILLMTSQGHAGLYIGNGEVIEVTPAWTNGNPGCQISKIGKNGERFKNGIQILSWEYHGRIPVIEYVNPTPVVVDPFAGVSNEELAKRVWNGDFGNGDERKNALGIRYDAVQALVDQGICKPQPEPTPQPTVDILDLTRRAIRGDFGNGDARRNALGSNYDEVQRQVNLNIQNGLTSWDNIKLF
jgi:hypothetical protein